MPNPPAPTDTPLIVHSEAPFNAEPPLDQLRASFITPQHRFYVRSHGAVPTLDRTTHRLRIDGLVSTPLTLSVDDLQSRFPARTLTATLQCAGNRRADLQGVRPTSGDPWAAGAIGTAEWTGAPLSDVLHAAGLHAAGAHRGDGLHVAFLCADACEMDGNTVPFGVSIPLPKALAPEVLLAYAMNGEPLEPRHGAPLRVVVPGYAGVRSPKWLTAITVQDRPSDNPVQAHDYKLFPPHITKATSDPRHGLTIDAMPVTSAICEPARHARLAPGPCPVRGYALASGRPVLRVDVSPDGGHTWQQAALDPAAAPAAPWAWTFWSTTLDLPPGEHELAVRAWDSAGQTQPALPNDTWNFKGYLSTAWHRVPVVVA